MAPIKKKIMKPIKPRQRPPRSLATLPNKVRTTGTIINNLTVAKANRPMPLSKYVHCRLNPFNAMGATAIPDGSNANFFVNDARMTDTIALNGTNREFLIQTVPMMPSLAMIGTTGGTGAAVGLTVSGSQLQRMPTYQPSSAVVSPAILNTYYPLSTIQGFVGNMPHPNFGYQDPFSSTSARLISVGYRLTYTGPVTTCSGSIQVTPTSIGFGPAPASTDNTSGVQLTDKFTYTQQSATGLIGIATQEGTLGLSVDLNINANATTRETLVFRPEQSITILPRHKTKDYKICPTLRRVVMPIVSADGSSFQTAQQQSIFIKHPSTVGTDGVIWYDEDWESITVYASGLNADAVFRWDTIACFEFNPNNASVFAPFTQKASPNMPADIMKVQAITNATAVAIPTTFSGFNDAMAQDALPSSMRGAQPSWKK